MAHAAWMQAANAGSFCPLKDRVAPEENRLNAEKMHIAAKRYDVGGSLWGSSVGPNLLSTGNEPARHSSRVATGSNLECLNVELEKAWPSGARLKS